MNSMSVVCNWHPIPPMALFSGANFNRGKRRASRSLLEMPMVKIMRNTGNNHLSSSPGGAGCLPARTRHLPLIRQDNIRITQPSVGKRRRLAVFGTINCREQLISAHGCLERVPKAANRLRLMTRRFSRLRFVLTNSDWRAHRILDVQGIQRSWNSQQGVGNDKY